jgi:hypothetical protein
VPRVEHDDILSSLSTGLEAPLSYTYGLVFGGGGGDCPLRAAVARIGGVDDGDLVNTGSAAALRQSSRKDWEEEGSELRMHFDGVFENELVVNRASGNW